MRFLSRSLASLVVVAALVGSVGPVGFAATPARPEFQTALDKGELPAAWSAMSLWKDAAPADPAPRLAEAQLYLKLNAPAAAISAANAGLDLVGDNNRALERSLLGLKAQAHTAASEHASAWAAFSRVLLRAQPEEQNDPLVAMARRARWDAFAQISTNDAYGRFIARLTAATSAPDATPAAHIRLAHWLQTSQNTAAALEALRGPFIAQPQSPELRAAFADLFFTAASAVAPQPNELVPLFKQNSAALALLAQGPDADPLATALLAYMRPTPAAPSAPARQPPKDLIGATRTFLATLAERRAKQIARLTEVSKDWDLAHDEVTSWINTPIATLAEIVAWEKKVLAAVTTLRSALAEMRRLDETASFLESVFEGRAGSATVSAEEKTVFAELQKAKEPTDAQKQTIDDTAGFEDTMQWTAVALRKQRRIAAAMERLSTAKTPAEQLAVTDDALAAGGSSGAMWRARAAAATALGDRAEAAASGARAFLAEWIVEGAELNRVLPPATSELLASLEREVAEAPGLVTRAHAAWESGQPEQAFAHLDRALALDPALPAAWRLRWQWCEAGGDLAGAALALDRWWRLDERTPYDRTVAFDIASRAGAWELLLSMADTRLTAEPTDTEAHYFRAHAALACGRFGIVTEELPLLWVSLQAGAARPLELALACMDPVTSPPSFEVGQLAQAPAASPALMVLHASVERLKRGTAVANDAKPAGRTASPADIHVDRLGGRVSPTDYLAKTRGTPEEPMAAFVTFFLISRAEGSPESWAMAQAISADARLPLAMRALAHQHLVRDRKIEPLASLRASDLHYASAARAEEWWGAPGQEVLLDRPVNLAKLPAELPLRLRGVDTTAAVKLSDPAIRGTARARLVELRNLTVGGAFVQRATPADQAAIFIARDVNFERSAEVKVSGFARVENSFVEWANFTVARGAALELRNVRGYVLGAQIEGRLAITGGRLEFSSVPSLTATARAEVRGTEMRGSLPFALAPGATALWQDVIAQCNNPWPAQIPASWTVVNSRIAAPYAGATQAILPLPAPHSGQLYVLASGSLTASVTTAKDLAALLAALRVAKPGDKLVLGPGDHYISGPIEVPAGVTIEAAPNSKLFVARALSGAFIFPQAGAASLRNFHNEVVRAPAADPRFDVFDNTPKTAVTVGKDAWVIIENGTFFRWSHLTHTQARVAAGGRLEFRNHYVDNNVLVQPGGKIITDLKAARSALVLRESIAQRTRHDMWQSAEKRYTAGIARATNRAERVEATRALGEIFSETARITNANRSETTRRYLTSVVPVVQRYPTESPQIFLASNRYEVGDNEVAKEMLPANLRTYFTTFVKSFNEAQRIGLNSVSMDNVYDMMLSYPPGSAKYAAAQKAMERNLTVAQFEKEQADKLQRELQVAAALKKQREEEAKRRAEEYKRAAQYADRRPAPASSGSSSGWSSSSYSPPSYTPPAWTPSESYKMQVYRQNLDVQISRVTRGY